MGQAGCGTLQAMPLHHLAAHLSHSRARLASGRVPAVRMVWQGTVNAGLSGSVSV